MQRKSQMDQNKCCEILKLRTQALDVAASSASSDFHSLLKFILLPCFHPSGFPSSVQRLAFIVLCPRYTWHCCFCTTYHCKDVLFFLYNNRFHSPLVVVPVFLDTSWKSTIRSITISPHLFHKPSFLPPPKPSSTIMSIQKKPTTNILTACLALSIILLLWRTFGSDVVHHAGVGGSGLYHPTSLFLTNGHLQTRHIKPQTLPKRKLAHPFLQQQMQHRFSSDGPAGSAGRAADDQPLVLPASTETQPATSSDHQPESIVSENAQGGAPPTAAPEAPTAMALVTCSQDMSLQCLPDQ